jgi:hypothetical protein
MNRRDRKAAVSKAKANGMNRRDRKALGRSLKAQSMERPAYGRKGEVLNAALAASDDWQAVGQRKRDLIEGQKKFRESEVAALKTRPGLVGEARKRKSDELFREYAADKYKLN